MKLKALAFNTGWRHLSILGSPDGESSDDSLADLVCMDNSSIAQSFLS